MPALQLKSYTIDDIYALPDGKRAELIDGQIYYMSPPTIRHQEISLELSAQIRNYIKKKSGKCKVYAAPFAVFLNENDKTYVEPDISVICDKNKLENGKGCMGVPDWIIEIVSPSSKHMDYFIKLFKYRSAGVREYWIVDPMRESIDVYYFESERMERYTFLEKIKVGIYEDLEIDFSEMKME